VFRSAAGNDEVAYRVGVEMATLRCSVLKQVGWFFFGKEQVTPSYAEFTEMTKQEALAAILHALFTTPAHGACVLEAKALVRRKESLRPFVLRFISDGARGFDASLATYTTLHERLADHDASSYIENNEVKALAPGYCPHGYKGKLIPSYCTPDDSMGVPLKWAVNTERKVLEGIMQTFMKLLQVNIERKMLPRRSAPDGSIGCAEDSTLEAWLGLSYRKHRLKAGASAAVRTAMGALSSVKDTTVVRKLKKLISGIFKVLKKLVIGMESTAIANMIKTRLLATVSRYILTRRLLARVSESPPENGDARSAFANAMCRAYRRAGDGGDVVHDLLRIYRKLDFTSEKYVAETFADAVQHFALKLTKDAIAAVPEWATLGTKTVGDTFLETFKGTVEETIDMVITLFLSTPLPHPSDIFTYTVQAFDVVSCLRDSGTTVALYPAVVTWADAIEMQYAPDHMEAHKRNVKFAKTVKHFQAYNRCIAASVGSNRTSPFCVFGARDEGEEEAEESSSAP
jgi:hypothetical protein